jgi:N-methylhydantoinase B
MDTMFGALAQIVPHIIPAAGEGGNTVVVLGGAREDGRPFIVVDMICGCWGGRPDKDGVEAITNPSQNLSNTPVEVLERQHPVRIEEYALIPDSCGPGRYRGGLGLARSYRLLANEAVLQVRADRIKFPPYGLAGGQPGAPSANWIGEGNSRRPVAGKITMRAVRDDLVTHHQAGGGGHGNPLERNPDDVWQDVWNEKISPDFAYRYHGVVLHGGGVDAEATARQRARLRQERPAECDRPDTVSYVD